MFDLLKAPISGVISFLVRNKVSWYLLFNTVVRLSQKLEIERKSYVKKQKLFNRERKKEQKRLKVSQLVQSISPDLVVMQGPFAGLQYPHTTSIGSAFGPKIIGSYEDELHDVIRQMFSQQYEKIVNIGSAEGYYAAGFGRVFPNTEVLAVDTEPTALDLCKKMFALNGLNNLTVNDGCNAKDIRRLAEDRRLLILCDCEGCELTLFDDSNVDSLKYSDLLIETHDFAHYGIASILKYLFEETHNIISIYSSEDSEKVKRFRNCGLGEHDETTLELLLSEQRPEKMEWLYLTSKIHIESSASVN